ncbi:MAG: hypothetical protein EA394_02305 [Bacteroidia bacterium]|nr:MAG: hypothetical protein EA394_02305 [Bacteroidia bacterium]
MFELAEKIGEGNFRECFAVKGDPGLCVKRLKPDLGFLQRLQVWLLRRRMNHEELDTYNSLPGELKPFFNPILQAEKEYLVTARPTDFDGSHSKPVRDYGKINNPEFWHDVEHIVSLLDKHKIWFFDTFQVGSNIFVQRLSESTWRPIIVDYKHLGWKAFPMQFNLLLASEKRKKFYRSYRRFEQNFRG